MGVKWFFLYFPNEHAKIVLGMAAIAAANPLLQMTPYSFGYQTADGMTRTESGSGNTVQGQYSYTDANGDIRTVKYVADANGFRPAGDISVDKRTAAEAAALAAQAPKAPAPIAPPAPQWSNGPAFQSFNSWEQPKQFAAPVAPSWNAQPVAPFPGSLNYKVETPTHKIWVNY